jgi:hypothetical protein
MSEAMIRELATAIAQQHLLANWQWYLLMIALLIVGAAAGALAGGYLKQRGESYATKADFSEILARLEQTTAIAEEVKAAVHHADWSAKEWKMARRVKLEALMEALYSTMEWFERLRAESLFRGEVAGTNPLPKFVMLSRLYWPETFQAVGEFQVRLLTACQTLLSAKRDLRQDPAPSDMAAYQATFSKYVAAANDHYEVLLSHVSAIETQAAALMKQHFDPDAQ